MDTICVQLNNVTMQDATSVLNKETIHISNHPDCGQGWLRLNTCKPITIQFYSEKGPYPEHYNTADPKNTPNYVDSNYSFNLAQLQRQKLFFINFRPVFPVRTLQCIEYQ